MGKLYLFGLVDLALLYNGIYVCMSTSVCLVSFPAYLSTSLRDTQNIFLTDTPMVYI
jgi:hypothetical protein